jgi:hypothetical protein
MAATLRILDVILWTTSTTFVVVVVVVVVVEVRVEEQ